MNRGLQERVRARGVELGFQAVGFSAAGRARRAAAFRRWLDRGFAGEMGYLAREPEARADVTRRSPWALSIVSVAVSYAPPPEVEASRSAPGAGIAPLVA